MTNAVAENLIWGLTSPVYNLMTPDERAAVDACFHADAAPISPAERPACEAAFATAMERISAMTPVAFSEAYGVHVLEGEPLREGVLKIYDLCISGASREAVQQARSEFGNAA